MFPVHVYSLIDYMFTTNLTEQLLRINFNERLNAWKMLITLDEFCYDLEPKIVSKLINCNSINNFPKA